MKRQEMPFGWGRVSYSLENRRKWGDVPFSIEEYTARMKKVQDGIVRAGFDVLIVHGNRADRGAIRYLTNFEDYYKGDSLCIIPASGDVSFLTNSVMHGEPMHSGIQQVWIGDVRCAPHPRTVDSFTTIYDHLGDIIEEKGLQSGRIGVSGEYSREAQEFCQTKFPSATVTTNSTIVPGAMAIKSQAEIEMLRKSAHITDAALTAVMENCRPGVTEAYLASLAAAALFGNGAEAGNFPIALSSGPRSGHKHVIPIDRTLQEGDAVYTDLGAAYKGYAADCSRNTTVGKASKEQGDFYEANAVITEEVMAKAAPGVRICDLADIGIGIAKKLGVEQWLYFRGHGISTFTHVPPSFFPTNKAVLEKNMVFCFEPMLVKEGFGTGCVEDMWVVLDDKVESLNTCKWRWW